MPRQVRTISIYRKFIEQLQNFRLISPPLTEALAQQLGFEGIPAEGNSILPTAVGPATTFNAYGKEIVRDDLPMETLSRMIHTSWQDWHGHTHFGVQTREYKAYPRDRVPPPGEFLIAIRKDGETVAASRVIQKDEPEADIVNLLNIFLEAFPSFEIVQPDLTTPTQIRRLSWKILPQGEYPFERARNALNDYLQRLSEHDRGTATERIKAITRHHPDFIAVGLGGFSDYVVFGFTDRRRYVFESPNSGNATYIFRNNWELISHLSKREILQENLHETRIIHNSKWYGTLNHAINNI